jgi:hypothetical protein
LPLLVEFAVARQITFRNDAKNDAAVDDDGAIEELCLGADRRADDDRERPIAARRDDLGQGRERRLEQRVLEEEIVVGIARDSELGEENEPGVALGRSVDEAQRFAGILGRGRQSHDRRRDGRTKEAVAIERPEGQQVRGGGRRHPCESSRGEGQPRQVPLPIEF